MARPIDVLDPAEIAELLGVSRQRVHQLRREHDDFPEPVIERTRAIFWLRKDVEAWAEDHGYLEEAED
jgi:predicted DNA-binding transcriptional regulator AlpA